MDWAKKYGDGHYWENWEKNVVIPAPVLIDGVPAHPDEVDPTKHEYVGILRPASPPPKLWDGQAQKWVDHATGTTHGWGKHDAWTNGVYDRLSYRTIK